MRKIHMRDFNYGTTSSGMGYVVYRYKFFKHGTNLLKVCLFFWFLGFYGVFCLFQNGGKLKDRQSLWLHEAASEQFDFVIWFSEYLDLLPKNFKGDAKSFWQKTLDCYKVVCFFLEWGKREKR